MGLSAERSERPVALLLHGLDQQPSMPRLHEMAVVDREGHDAPLQQIALDALSHVAVEAL
jgi:hypothetical protein